MTWTRRGSTKSRETSRPTQTRIDRGAAAVEFALVLPILLTLIFGIINFGFIFSTQISLNNSARDAARAGVVKPLTSAGAAKTCSEIATLGRDGSKTIGLTDTKAVIVTVTNPDATYCTWGQGVSMTTSAIPMCKGGGQLMVQLQYTVVPPIPMPLSSPTLKATGAFQCEYS
jgi:Flp pilus assembly protein TadG